MPVIEGNPLPNIIIYGREPLGFPRERIAYTCTYCGHTYRLNTETAHWFWRRDNNDFDTIRSLIIKEFSPL